MPELAEVEYSRYQFHQYGLNSEIIQVNTKRNDNNEYDTIIYENSENEILETLNRSKIISANRKGNLFFLNYYKIIFISLIIIIIYT
jgi:formamidopyrimidine-DNA glycosylase